MLTVNTFQLIKTKKRVELQAYSWNCNFSSAPNVMNVAVKFMIALGSYMSCTLRPFRAGRRAAARSLSSFPGPPDPRRLVG